MIKMVQLRDIKKEDIPFLIKIMEENEDTTRFDAEKWYEQKISGKLGSEVKELAILSQNSLIGVIGFCFEECKYVLTWFHLSKEFQKQGFGSQALSQLEKMLAPCTIRVDTGYPKAVKFYEKNGYLVTKVMPNYYPSGSPNTVLIKEVE